jgi:outer membrane protein assembly factor BamB
MLRLTLFGSLVLVLSATSSLTGADNPPPTTNWPQWRGPNRDDLSTDTGLLKQWPQGGPPLLWEAKGAGRGYASVAITGGKIYTMGDRPSTAKDGDEYLLCFDEAAGKQLWKTKLGPAWDQGQPNWQSSRSTPTVDGELLYILTPYGKLVCLETAGGKERWHKDFKKDFGGRKGDGWGYSESVLVDGDKVIGTPGGEKATVVALNKKTGQTIWTASVPGDLGAGHASMVTAQMANTRIYVQTIGGRSESAIFGLRAQDGKVLWNHPLAGATAIIPTPLVQGDLVFVSAGYGRGGTLLRQVPAGAGIKVEEVYPLQRELNNKHGGIVHVGDFLYGDTDSSGTPWCAEFMTGKVRWKKRGSGRGSAAITYADGHLYVRYDDGTLVLALAAPDEYKEVSSFKIPHSGDRPSWSHPVVAGGKLFLREGDYLLCYDLRAK